MLILHLTAWNAATVIRNSLSEPIRNGSKYNPHHIKADRSLGHCIQTGSHTLTRRSP